MTIQQQRITIEGISPVVDCGRFAVKTVAGDTVAIEADIYKDGHDLLCASVLYRSLNRSEIKPGNAAPIRSRLDRQSWKHAVMSEGENDRWSAVIEPDSIGMWVYTVCAWTDVFGSWRNEVRKKWEAGNSLSCELEEGMLLIQKYREHAPRTLGRKLLGVAKSIEQTVDEATRVALACGDELASLMHSADPRADCTVYPIELPLRVDRTRARYGSWYELFVRSQGKDAKKSATFRDAEKRLPALAAMGFDVVYLTPIHPIGTTHRKGRNNSENALPGDPGSPWAIGAPEGGHRAVHPMLGTLDDFDHFVETAQRHNMEVALDFAIQCSPDHPWVSSHPEWFQHRPDGTIKYAENPPKKYEDIYPIDFDTADRDGLYGELLDVLRFWIQHGVKIFRVDNPHTKAFTFWEWVIASVQRDAPDVVFLAEAFTRPKRMKRLAKLGFSQSYTYFTWRTDRDELADYATELFCTDVRHYFRPNFFTNTPDILHAFLQQGGPPAFRIRLFLAATLSPSYGIYSGFELFENRAVHEGSEEYLDSEKYQVRPRDYDRPDSLTDLITRVNHIRKSHPCLQHGNHFPMGSTCPDILAFAKATPSLDSVLFIVVSVEPNRTVEGTVGMPYQCFSGGDDSVYQVTDLLSGATYTWRGWWNYVKLDPTGVPAHILRISSDVR